MSGTSVTDADCKTLVNQFPESLEHLELNDCKNLTGLGIAEFKMCRNLKILELNHCGIRMNGEIEKYLTTEGLKNVLAVVSIDSLIIRDAAQTDEHPSFFATELADDLLHSNSPVIQVSIIGMSESKFEDDDQEVLLLDKTPKQPLDDAKFTEFINNLNREDFDQLWIFHASLGKTSLNRIAEFSNVAVLRIHYLKLEQGEETASLLEQLEIPKKVKEFDLVSSGITDRDVDAIQFPQSVTKFNLYNVREYDGDQNRLDGSFIENLLKKRSDLKSIVLPYVSTLDFSKLEALKEAKNLQSLILGGIEFGPGFESKISTDDITKTLWEIARPRAREEVPLKLQLPQIPDEITSKIDKEEIARMVKEYLSENGFPAARGVVLTSLGSAAETQLAKAVESAPNDAQRERAQLVLNQIKKQD